MCKSTTRRVFFVLLCLCPAFHQSVMAQDGDKAHQTAQDYIDKFRRGEAFHGNAPVADIVTSIRSSQAELTILAKELAEGTTEVRLQLVELLEKIGFELDTVTPDRFPLIRDHRIIRILLVQGYAKEDQARNAAAGALRIDCTPSDLAAFGHIYTNSLQQLTGQYLRLATKAKTIEASPYVEKMARSPKWQTEPEWSEMIQIAQAALGNQLVEDKFIKAVRDEEKNAPPAPKNRFYNVGTALDGTELARRLATLGEIGTRRSLQVVCSYLRSTLKSYVVNIRERSVRYAALDALRYNFPDERVLHLPSDLDQWRAAEQFCTTHVGAVFNGPTPHIARDQIYPHMWGSKPLPIAIPTKVN